MFKKNKRNFRKNINYNINLSYVAIFIIFIVAILILAAITTGGSSSKKVETSSPVVNMVGISYEDKALIDNEKEAETEKLREMTERDRIDYYASKFLNDIESGNYEEAYGFLNKDFKRNYFKNLSDFEKYMKEHFSKMMEFNYTNIERNGDVYILWITVTDVINGGKDSGKEYNIVVKENNYNDFELSFSVI